MWSSELVSEATSPSQALSFAPLRSPNHFQRDTLHPQPMIVCLSRTTLHRPNLHLPICLQASSAAVASIKAAAPSPAASRQALFVRSLTLLLARTPPRLHPVPEPQSR